MCKAINVYNGVEHDMLLNPNIISINRECRFTEWRKFNEMLIDIQDIKHSVLIMSLEISMKSIIINKKWLFLPLATQFKLIEFLHWIQLTYE